MGGSAARPGHPALPRGVRPGGRFEEWKRPTSPAYVLCDVDGTLIGPQDLATDEVLDAVGRLQSRGARVGYATGRMRNGVRRLHRQLGARGPHVLHDGAELRADGATVASWPLRDDQVDTLLAISSERDDLYAEVYTETGFHVSSWDERARPHWALLGSPPSGVLEKVAELDGAPVLKVTFAVFTRPTVEWLVGRVRDVGLRPGPATSPRTPQIGYVNATRPDVDKGRALIRAAAHLGVEVADVVAVGDARNDLPMLGEAGTAIAMGQADRAVQAAAHVVVPEVSAHGVAVALDFVAWCQDLPGT